MDEELPANGVNGIGSIGVISYIAANGLYSVPYKTAVNVEINEI